MEDDRIKHGFDSASTDNQGQSLDEPYPARLECGRSQSVRKGELGIAQHFERQMQAFGHFALIIRGLCAQAEQFRLDRGEFLVMVAKGASLRCAASRSRDQVPSLRQWPSWYARH